MNKKPRIKFCYPHSPTKTINLIRGIPYDHQAIIARIVWWDFFAIRLVADRTSLFDKWIIPPKEGETIPPEPPYEHLMKSLMKVGYPHYLAHQRLRPKHSSKKKSKTVA